MQEHKTLFYGRFPFAPFCLLVGPLLLVLAVATYVLVTAASPIITLAAQVASAIVGFILILLLTGFVLYASMLRRPMLTLATSSLQRKDLALRWGDVSNIGTQRHLGQPYVAVTLRDPEAFLKAIPSYVATTYARQFKRTQNSILIPAMRGLSFQQLYDLIEHYWKNASAADPARSAPSSAIYSPLTSAETASAFASLVFGVFIFLRWMDLINSVRDNNLADLLVNAAYAIGASGAAYVLSLVVLSRVQKAHPGFDVWQKMAIPQDVVGGVDTTIYDAVDRKGRVRGEPYIARLQKAPWRVMFYSGLLGGGGMLISSGLLFCSMLLIYPGTPGARVAEVFATARPLWVFSMVLALASLAIALTAFLNLRCIKKSEPNSGV